MWGGYRTKPGNTSPKFSVLTGTWAKFHTGGHASPGDLRHVIEKAAPEIVIPMYTGTLQKVYLLTTTT